MIEYTDSTLGTNQSSYKDITFFQKKTITNNQYNIQQKEILDLLSELNNIEHNINIQRHQTLEAILKHNHIIDNQYINLIVFHQTVNSDIIKLREQLYKLLINKSINT